MVITLMPGEILSVEFFEFPHVEYQDPVRFTIKYETNRSGKEISLVAEDFPDSRGRKGLLYHIRKVFKTKGPI